MIYSYFWDYPVQIYPQVDYVLVSKLESGGFSQVTLQEELTDPLFWDLYVSMDTSNYPAMDVFRVIQKLSQYCAGSLSFEELHSIFSKMIKLTKSVKSLFLRENPHMITRELFEKSISDLISTHKVVDG
jgi:hypothetical protein